MLLHRGVGSEFGIGGIGSEFQYRTTFTRFLFLFCIVPLNTTSRSRIFLFFSSLCVYLPKYRSCFCITSPHLQTCLFPHLSVLIRDIISGCVGRREGKISRWTLSNPFLPFLPFYSNEEFLAFIAHFQ